MALLTHVVTLSMAVSMAGSCVAPPQARLVKDIAYVADGNLKQRLDLYVPARYGYPTVVFVHGGAWVMGDRAEAMNRSFAAALQAKGIGCALISYRLVPEAKPADQLADVAAAFAWAKRSVSSYGGATDRVYLVGHSAGGQLSALVASDRSHLKPYGLDPSAVAGVVTIGAPLAMALPNLSLDKGPDWLRSAVKGINAVDGALAGLDPLRALGVDSPRTLVLTGADDYLPIKIQAKAYEAAAKLRRAKVAFETLADRSHVTTLSRMAEPADPGFASVVKFIEGEGR